MHINISLKVFLSASKISVTSDFGMLVLTNFYGLYEIGNESF